MTGNLTSRAFHGIKWSYASTAITSVLQIFLSAIMARLLSPEAFGLVAMAMVVVSFGGYFAKMGIGPALVQKKELTTADVHAAFVLSSGLGLSVALIVVFAAPLATLLFDQPEVVPVVRALGLSFAITGISSTALHLLQRNLDFRALGLISIISYAVAYGIIGIGLAYLGFGVWSLVVASLTQLGIAAVCAIGYVRHGVAFITSSDYYRPLLSFGGRFSMIGLLDFTGSSLDKLLIGRYLGSSLLGLYDRAHLLAFLPARKLSASFSNVLFPSFSRLQSNIPRLRRGYLTTMLLFGVLIVPACVGLSAAAREAVLVLLGDQWVDAIPVLQILALAVALRVLTSFSTVTCEATAQLNARIVLQVLFIVLLCAFFYLFRNRGLTGFALALLCAQGARHLGYTWVIQRSLHIPVRDLVRAYAPGLLYSAIIGGNIAVLSHLLYTAGMPAYGAFAIEIATGGLLLGLCVFAGSVGEVRLGVVRVLAKLNLGATDRVLTWMRRSPATHPALVLMPLGALPLVGLAAQQGLLIGADGTWTNILLAWNGLRGGLPGALLFTASCTLGAVMGLLWIGHSDTSLSKNASSSPPEQHPDAPSALPPRSSSPSPNRVSRKKTTPHSP